jgi:hypothetical protein
VQRGGRWQGVVQRIGARGTEVLIHTIAGPLHPSGLASSFKGPALSIRDGAGGVIA